MHTVKWRHNVVKYCKIHSYRNWGRISIIYAGSTKDTSYLALMGELWGSLVDICGRIDRVITAPHCMNIGIIHRRIKTNRFWWQMHSSLSIIYNFFFQHKVLKFYFDISSQMLDIHHEPLLAFGITLLLHNTCSKGQFNSYVDNFPACRTSLIATRFWGVVICPIIKCLTVLEFSFILLDLCLFITIFNFILNYVPIVTFWIFTYHKIWILLIIFCFVWYYWIIYFLTCLEVFWSVVS